jgi:IS1 family transposase
MKQLSDDLMEYRILYIEIGSTRSHSAEKSLWKRPWTCRKADRGMIRVNISTYAFVSPNTKLRDRLVTWTRRPQIFHKSGVYLKD